MKFAKKFCRWLILGLTLFFIFATFKNNWRELMGVKFTNFTWLMLVLSLFFNILAHSFSAWVWTWILTIFNTKLQGLKAIKIYLITNINKYLPGNIWHFFGRVKAIQAEGDSLALATVSVIIEPLLMAVSALFITVMSASIGIIEVNFSPLILIFQLIFIIIVLVSIHPKIINPILSKLAKGKGSKEIVNLTKYPLLPLLGEVIFLLLRGFAFLLILLAFIPLKITLIPQVLSGFSFAWLLGLIVPGAPGGIGIFEATIITTFNQSFFPTEIVLIVVALFRINSILAELITAGIASIFK